jgi:hypothetical protein
VLLPGFGRAIIWLPSKMPGSDKRSHTNRSCSSLYSIGTDRRGNTSPNSSIFAQHSYRNDRVKITASQLLHSCMLRICYLATGVFVDSYHNNGCLRWLHSSCLEQICHNIREPECEFLTTCLYDIQIHTVYISRCTYVRRPCNDDRLRNVSVEARLQSRKFGRDGRQSARTSARKHTNVHRWKSRPSNVEVDTFL